MKDNYEKYYSEENFKSKIKKMGKKAGAEIIEKAFILFYVLVDKNTPVKDKTIIVAALGYLILPLDLIPDFTPLLGYTDDLSGIVLALNKISKNVTEEHKRLAKEQVDKILR